MTKNILFTCLMIAGITLLGGCSSTSQFISQTFSLPSSQPYVASNAQLSDDSFWQGSANQIWGRLTQVSLSQLETASVSDPVRAAWVKLALINRQDSTNNQKLGQDLIAWRAANPGHPANAILPNDATLSSLASLAPPQHIALLLPLQGANAASGQAVKDGFLNSYYQGLSTGTKQTISFYDTNSTPNMATLYQKAISEGADFVVGPLLKNNVEDLTRSGSFTVPTLELNYTDIGFGSLPSNVYQFGLSPLDESQQMADKAASAKLSRALIIAPRNAWGQRNLTILVSRWKSLGGSVQDTYLYSNQANFTQDIANLLHVNPKKAQAKMNSDNSKTALEKQRRQDFDVIFLLADSQNAHAIVPLLKFYYADNVPIYATSSISSETAILQKDPDLNGVTFCDIPWVLEMNHGNRLSAVGQDAYMLTRQIPRLSLLPQFPIYGSTGALTLTSKHQIYRQISWTKMQNGTL